MRIEAFKNIFNNYIW